MLPKALNLEKLIVMQTCFNGTKGIAKYLPKGGTFYLKFETNEISKISPKKVLSV